MATVTAPKGSFIQFIETDTQHCIWDTVRFTLPVYSEDDVAFQFFVTGTADEIDELAGFYSSGITVGLVSVGDDDLDEPTILEFSEEPERYKLSDTLMLYQWPWGLPGLYEVVDINECFKIQVTLNLSGGGETQTSNRLIRVGDTCFSSVLEYSNDDNAFGFNYCVSADDFVPPSTDPNIPPEAMVCAPTAITFTNLSTFTLPYTTQLLDAYGSTPTVQVWLADIDGTLVLSNIQAKMDQFPPTQLIFDFGGNASGLIIVK